VWRVLGAAVAAAALAVAAPSAARPFTVDDLLHQQSFGAAAIDPSGRWLIVERLDPYDTADRYDELAFDGQPLKRLLIEDLAHPGPMRVLAAGRGLAIGDFSPLGARLAVTRLADGHLTLGVLTLATGEIRWLGLTPDGADWGRAVQWISEDRLLVIDRSDGSLPFNLRQGSLAADRLPKMWSAQMRGEASAVVNGSGAYVGLRGTPAPRRLVSVDLATGETRSLLVGQLSDMELSPDGRHVAVLEYAEDIPLRADRPITLEWGFVTRRQRLRVIDLATGEVRRPCETCDVQSFVFDWSASGRRLLVYVRQGETSWEAGRLLVVDAQSGFVRAVGEPLHPLIEGRPERIRAAWMGETPILLARPSGGARADWYRLGPGRPVALTAALPEAPHDLVGVDAAGATAIAGGRLWRLEPDGRVRRLADQARDARRPPALESRSFFAQPAGAWITTSASVGGRQLAFVEGGAIRAAIPLPGEGNVLAASRRRRVAVLRRRTFEGVETVSLTGVGFPEVALAAVNASLGEIDAPRILPVRHLGPEGQPLTSWLYLPPTRPGSPPPPLVVRAYLGDRYPGPPTDGSPPYGFAHGIRMLLGHGYAVLTPSLPKPAGTNEPLAGMGARLLQVVDQAAKDPVTAGAFDPQRLAIWGYSYGGYTVMAALGQTDRFKAGVEIAGISDLVVHWGQLAGAPGVAPEEKPWSISTANGAESAQGSMGLPPWADPARYVRNSPLFYADRIATPLLMVRGDQDPLPITQGDLMFSALVRQNKDAILVTYRGETHQILSPGNVRDLWRRAFAFLDAHLGPATRIAMRADYPGHDPANSEPTPPASRP
jgi:dipeptidyl aminopeptidase/acylaminoacyl peptidase